MTKPLQNLKQRTFQHYPKYEQVWSEQRHCFRTCCLATESNRSLCIYSDWTQTGPSLVEPLGAVMDGVVSRTHTHTKRDFQQRRSHVLTTSISSCFSSFSPPLSQSNILHPPPPLFVPLLPSHLPVRSHSRNVARAGRARDEKMKQEYPTNPSHSLQATPLKPATVTLTFLFNLH